MCLCVARTYQVSLCCPAFLKYDAMEQGRKWNEIILAMACVAPRWDIFFMLKTLISSAMVSILSGLFLFLENSCVSTENYHRKYTRVRNIGCKISVTSEII